MVDGGQGYPSDLSLDASFWSKKGLPILYCDLVATPLLYFGRLFVSPAFSSSTHRLFAFEPCPPHQLRHPSVTAARHVRNRPVPHERTCGTFCFALLCNGAVLHPSRSDNVGWGVMRRQGIEMDACYDAFGSGLWAFF